jgi:hypothetical protein
MAATHGTRWGYLTGCRCADCRHAQRIYQRNYRERRANGLTRPSVVAELPPSEPGRVEIAIRQEIEGSALAAARPALVETAVSLAKILDNPRAISQQAAAAGKLVDILDTLHEGAAPRRGGLKLVRAMTTTNGGT